MDEETMADEPAIESTPATETPTYMPGQENMRERFVMQDGKLYHHVKHDVSKILEANHFLRGEQGMRHKSETMNHVASVDIVVIKNWMNQRGIYRNWWSEFNRDPKLVNEFLNDPDNAAWRTRKGKI